ncbi:MAG TPA: VacJ family lipoprotein [Aquabacterium sp.]|nr:VacJ family lipoprotein [Aquabacterium sp.]
MTVLPESSRRGRAGLLVLGLTLVAGLQGCATRNPQDPLEPWNRQVFAFNESVDAHILKPVAEGYVKVTPDPVRHGITNVFANISDVWTTANLFLQGRLRDGAQSTMRVMVNSTLGLAGLIDLATPMQLPRFHEDLGQTLGVWGTPPGAYIVWPFLGVSTVRDSVTYVGDYHFSAANLVDRARERNVIRGVQVVDTRAQYLSASDLLDDISLDKYAFMRDAYLQRRESLIHNGEVPTDDTAPEPRYDEPEDAETPAAVEAPASAASAASAASGASGR